MQTRDGPVDVPLCNFTARIVADVVRDDGAETVRTFDIEATLAGKLIRTSVPAHEFATMNWVIRDLGAAAVVEPGLGIKDQCRAAIQTLSSDIVEREVLAHSGWRRIGDEEVYLHAGGAIGREGLFDGVATDLGGDAGLANLDLPPPLDGKALVDALEASLGVLNVAHPSITTPLYSAIWRSIMGAVSFCLWLAGETGAMKTVIAALVQQHFGPQADWRNLPANWSSTANALELQAFTAKDAILVIDDFVPGDSPQESRAAYDKAARILRAQGNRAGRARLSASGILRPAKPPRGLIVSTGEDLPVGHSIRARCGVVQVGRGAVDVDKVTEAQRAGADGLFAAATSSFMRWIAKMGIDQARQQFREQVSSLMPQVGAMAHPRTPTMVAELGAAMWLFLRFCREVGVLREHEFEPRWNACWAALIEFGRGQTALLGQADVALRYLELLGAALTSGRAHLSKADDAGVMPPDPSAVGWRRGGGGWQPQGVRIGSIRGSDVYLEPDVAYACAQQMAQAQDRTLGVTRETLQQRFKEKGILSSSEPGRTTARPVIEGRQQHHSCRIKSPIQCVVPNRPNRPRIRI